MKAVTLLTGELRQRALIGGLTIDFLPPMVTTPSFQTPNTQQVLNDSKRYELYNSWLCICDCSSQKVTNADYTFKPCALQA